MDGKFCPISLSGNRLQRQPSRPGALHSGNRGQTGAAVLTPTTAQKIIGADGISSGWLNEMPDNYLVRELPLDDFGSLLGNPQLGCQGVHVLLLGGVVLIDGHGRDQVEIEGSGGVVDPADD
ncbi:hypothetical protein AUP74_01011 [Microbulbifer aggregans]|uniref:Uncharacterized protein n=1 Tax=Microbulbifer aggregans TaxID=1769779 RepID=A0A1C9W5P0_9GAMM|nr:hypothetical protein AUP74_01011 [Microbulbifer aggregans]